MRSARDCLRRLACFLFTASVLSLANAQPSPTEAPPGDYLIFAGGAVGWHDPSTIRYRGNSLQSVCEEWGNAIRASSPAHASWITTWTFGQPHSYCYFSSNGQPDPGTGGYNYQFVQSCVYGAEWSGAPRYDCVRYRDIYGEPKCIPCIENPIYPLTGLKSQEVDLGIRIGGRAVTLTYDTGPRLPGTVLLRGANAPAVASFGPLWQSSLHKRIQLQSDTGQPGTANSSVLLQRGAGVISSAVRPGASGCVGGSGGGAMTYVGSAARPYSLTFSGSLGTLVDAEAMTVESYLADGAAGSVGLATGGTLTYTYSGASTPSSVAPAPGLLIDVADSFGRTVHFEYEQPSIAGALPRVVRIVLDDGTSVVAGYDGNGNLRDLTWADGRVRTFLYEHALGWPMTGIVDENAKRYATYSYDAQGRATGTEHAGGANRSTVTYGTAPGWSVTETTIGNTICRDHQPVAPSGTQVVMSLGQISNLDAITLQGRVGLTSQSRAAGSGSAASTSSRSYDANGKVASRDDFNGARSCYANDPNRNLAVTSVDGLSQGTACSAVTPLNAALPAGSRKTSIQWHPDWDLQTRRAEAGRIITSVYNGQPDPLNSNAIASCAPANAVLSDGKPIAVLCKRVEQSTTDANGAQGFGAALQSGVALRATTWTYDQWGKVLTENGPRTDVNDVTTYTYHSSTSFTGTGAAAEGYTTGDLASVTNAAGQVTLFTKYNKHGQLLQSSDANGVVTTHTYDLRQRLLSSTVAGQTTAYTYDAAGQLKRVTLPDASWVGYDYDDAHRQVAVYDNRGNRIEYTLDNAGNRTEEKTKGSSGAVKRLLTRSIDALGRVQQTVGRE